MNQNSQYAIEQSPFISKLKQYLNQNKSELFAENFVCADDSERIEHLRDLISNLPHKTNETIFSEKDILKLSNFVYDQLYDFDVWYPSLKKAGITDQADVICLTPDEIDSMYAATQKLIAFVWRYLFFLGYYRDSFSHLIS